MNSAGDRGSVFIEKKGSREEAAGTNHKQSPRGLWEGWDGVGGPPSPSLVGTHGASRERINRYKRNRIAGGVISKWRLIKTSCWKPLKRLKRI